MSSAAGRPRPGPLTRLHTMLQPRPTVLMDAPIPGIGPWDDILKSPLLWHFPFGGPDMERLVAGRERIYLDRFWNEFTADPSKINEAARASGSSATGVRTWIRWSRRCPRAASIPSRPAWITSPRRMTSRPASTFSALARRAPTMSRPPKRPSPDRNAAPLHGRRQRNRSNVFPRNLIHHQRLARSWPRACETPAGPRPPSGGHKPLCGGRGHRHQGRGRTLVGQSLGAASRLVSWTSFSKRLAPLRSPENDRDDSSA